MRTVKMEIVVGTYDEVIIGFHVVEIGDELQVEASFTDHSHAGCVKCVAISHKGVLASGSTDETIRLLDIKRNKELGSLVHHNGTVTSLEFHKNFLFSTSEDNKLCLWKTSSWECLRTFKGHKSAVNCVSVHPSGKLALTVGKDRALHTWNLITGRSAYITNLKQVANIVKWSPNGDKYAIAFNNKVDIYSVETAEITLSVQHEGNINCLEFLNDSVICYGGEGGKVVFHDITVDKKLHECDSQVTRIKGLCISQHNLRETAKTTVLTIASSEGVIKVYTITENESSISTELLVEHSTGFRLTCLAVYSDLLNDTSPAHKLTVEDVVQDTVDNDNSDSEDEQHSASTKHQTLKTSNKDETEHIMKDLNKKQNKNKQRKRKQPHQEQVLVENGKKLKKEQKGLVVINTENTGYKGNRGDNHASQQNTDVKDTSAALVSAKEGKKQQKKKKKKNQQSNKA